MRDKLWMAAFALAIITPVMVAPLQGQAATSDFPDVPKTHAAYTEIMAMKQDGMINGYTDGTFKPEQGIARQHVARLLTQVVPLEPIRPAATFTDVPPNHPYYTDIQRLYRAGIIDGFNGKFNPAESLTHAQIAKILCLAFQLEQVEEADFTNIGANHWAKDYVETLYAKGIMTGKFNEKATVTRAQYTVLLYRLLHADESSVHPVPNEVEPPADHQQQTTIEENTKIKLTFNNEEVIVKLENHPTSQDFLASLPLTLTFKDYAGTEKISYLPEKLSTEGAAAGIDPTIGDLTYYAPWGNLALFYQDFGYSAGLIKLGTVESGLEKLTNLSGDFTVTIDRADS